MSFVKHIPLQLAGEETRENLFIREIKTDDIIPNTNFIKLIYIYIYIYIYKFTSRICIPKKL